MPTTSKMPPSTSNSQKRGSYKSVNGEDEEFGKKADNNSNESNDFDDSEAYEDDPLFDDSGHRIHSRQRHRRPRPNVDEGSGGTVVGSWFCFLLLLFVIGTGLFLYWDVSKQHRHQDVSSTLQSLGRFRTRPPRSHGRGNNDDDDNDDDSDSSSYDKDDDSYYKDSKTTSTKKREPGTFYFDPFAAVQVPNPFDFSSSTVQDFYAQTLVPPAFDFLEGELDGRVDDQTHDNDRLGYIMQPDIVNGTVVFVTEGDMYLSRVPENKDDIAQTPIPAMKLTTTVGNVRNPKINPVYPYFVAYTGTYTGRRDIYLLDLRRLRHGNQPAMRLTYWPVSSGVRAVVGWKDDGRTLVFQAYSNEVSLPDVRMYELSLAIVDPNDSNHDHDDHDHDHDPLDQNEAKNQSAQDDDGHRKLLTDNSTTVPDGSSSGDINSTQTETDAETDANIQSVDSAQADANKTETQAEPNAESSTETAAPAAVNEPTSAETEAVPKTTTTVLPTETNQAEEPAKTKPTSVTIQHPQVLQTIPIPLAEALEGAYHDHEDCWYFTRHQQSSHTVRYQGGTVENIWSWCLGDQLAVSLTTHGFNGTSKKPTIFGYHVDGKKYHNLLFLSDRGVNTDENDPNEWKATTMNLWAMPLPEKEDLKTFANPDPAASNDNSTRRKLQGDIDWTQFARPIPSYNPPKFVQLTTISCDFDGMALQEYSLDPVTQNVVFRIGADLHFMSSSTIQEKLQSAFTGDGGRRRNLQQSNMESHDIKGKKRRAASSNSEIQTMKVLVYSDFHEHQERLIALSMPSDLTTGDVYETAFGGTSFLFSARGQVWIAPVIENDDSISKVFKGAGRNMPPRRYRVAPGAKMGGSVRILSCRHIPMPLEYEKFSRRVAVILATDPRSPTAEHAFYLIETQSDAIPTFISFNDLPEPFLGGHNGGGSVRNGGLGSIVASSVRVSPCGRRLAWSDTDGRICVMTLPLYKERASEFGDYTVLPRSNENGSYMDGAESILTWSPGGRYLAIEHNARNRFTVISIADCGDPLMVGSESEGEDLDERAAGVNLGRIVQVTPDRFNSFSPYWGKSTFDRNFFEQSESLAEAYGDENENEVATSTLFFLTDRDIFNIQDSAWGDRGPNPYFKQTANVYALPLISQQHNHHSYAGHFSGGGASELYMENMLDLKLLMKKEGRRKLSSSPSQAPTVSNPEEHFAQDPDIDFGKDSMDFARTAYRITNIPESTYTQILAQAKDDGSFVLVESAGDDHHIKVASIDGFPSDVVEIKEIDAEIQDYGLSTNRDYFFVCTRKYVVLPNTAAGFMSLIELTDFPESNYAYTEGLALSVWPSLEYQQIYGDAWRLMRDYFYDVEMTGIDWYAVFERYLPLVRRCAKREELDDVIALMVAQIGALHVFVYGGDYNQPLLGDQARSNHQPGSFGISVKRSAEWGGMVITSLPHLDPDFSLYDQEEFYSPLSHQTLRLSGQQGLKVGDVIVSVNGESVMDVPDIHMLLRGMNSQSVRLSVLRVGGSNKTKKVKPEPVIAVPIGEPDDLLLRAWEFKTRQLAKKLAAQAGITVGYVHLQEMSSPNDSDSFYRDYFPDHDKQGMIIDMRHNAGGSIDWWLLDVLQRKAFMYWEGRTANATTGGLGWDEHFAFRGHIVVLIDSKTSSDAETFSRGMSELGLGKLIGTRTWGGGIWLASDNTLVDGGVATAPEVGTYNKKWSHGMGIENEGVAPDILVDNNPRTTYDEEDAQLEQAIAVLKEWIRVEPVVVPKPPSKLKNMAYDDSEMCGAKP